MAVPGYYPDPWAPGQLRWWDGAAWTPHVSAPAAPAGRAPEASADVPQPAAPTSSAQPSSAPTSSAPTVAPGWATTVSGPTVTPVTPSYVVTGHRPRERAAGDRPVWLTGVAALSAVVVLALAAYTWTHRRTEPAASDVAVAPVAPAASGPAGGAPAASGGTGTTARDSSAGIDSTIVDGRYSGPIRAPLTTPHGRDLVTPADARAVMEAFWPQHETAVSEDDLAGIAALTTGAGRLYEVGARACGCWDQVQTRTLVAAAYFVRHQTSYPVDFLVEAQSNRSGAVFRWTDLYVFTKQGPGKPWLLALHSGYAPLDPSVSPMLAPPAVDASGYLASSAVLDTRRVEAVAPRLPGETATLWQRTNDTGVVAAHEDIVVQGFNQTRLDQIAAHRTRSAGDALGTYRFWLSPADPLFVYGLGDGSALVCRAVRETASYTAPPGMDMLQRSEFVPWGYPLAAGRYQQLATSSAWQTCWATTADLRQPSFLIDSEDDGGTTSAG